MKFKAIALSLFAVFSTIIPATALDIITSAPAGESKEYYADFQNFDNLFGFMGDYHTTQKLVFAEDGSVYIPNLLLRRTMPGYFKGTYDKAAKTITVEAGQWIFFFPNEQIPVALYPLDANGNAGPTPDTFYNNPLVFDLSEDGAITLRQSEEFPMFGLCNGLNSEIVYQNALDLRFVPTENVKSEIKHYILEYDIEGDNVSTTASGYKEGNDIYWIKGFDPKYPDAWIKIERGENGFEAKSFQVVFYFATEDPIVFAALLNNNIVTSLPVTFNESDGSLTAATDGITAANVTSDGESSFEIYQTYTNLSLSPTSFSIIKPAAPQFGSYTPANSSNETEFIFSSYATDINSNILPKDNLSFRMFVDGAAYTFTPALYRWISADMALVPYNFSNYNFFSIGGNDKEKRYVYFKNLAADVKTIGVEVVYNNGSDEITSDRLIYDIQTATADYAGIEDVIFNAVDGSVKYFDLQGHPVVTPQPGQIYIKVSGSKATKQIVR